LRFSSIRHTPNYKYYKYLIKISEGLKNPAINMDGGLMLLGRQEVERCVLLRFFKGFDWENPFAVTLTMTSKVWRDTSQNFRHFMNRLNQRLLGNSFRRYGNRLKVLPIIEGNSFIKPHYHCVIENPLTDDMEFVNAVKHAWWKTELRKPELHVEKMTDDGWIDYIMKRRSKTSVMDSVDWVNTHL